MTIVAGCGSGADGCELRVREQLTDRQRTERFLNKAKEVTQHAFNMNVAAQGETLRLVAGLREELAGLVGRTDFENFNFRRVREDLDRAVGEFAERYKIDLSDFQGRGWEFGQATLDGPFAAAGIEILLPAIPQSQLEALRATGAELVTGLGKEPLAGQVRRAMTREILLVQTGAKTQADAVKAVRDLLATTRRAKDGLFGGIAERARSIVRTEVSTAQEMAAEARRGQWLAEGVEDLENEWNGCKGRPRHLELNGTSVKAGERFTLIGQKRGKIFRPLHPKDRNALPVEEVVNCGGWTRPFKRVWDEFFAEDRAMFG